MLAPVKSLAFFGLKAIWIHSTSHSHHSNRLLLVLFFLMRLLWRHLAVSSRPAWPQIRGYSDTIDTVYIDALQLHWNLPDKIQKRGLSILKTPLTPGGLFICGWNPGRNADVVREPQKKTTYWKWTHEVWQPVCQEAARLVWRDPWGKFA